MINNFFNCYDILNCSLLDKAIEEHNLEKVKFICSILQIDYRNILYRNNSSYEIQTITAVNFADLEGYKYIQNKFVKEHPKDTYDGLTIEEQVNLAKLLLDLEGIKYIYTLRSGEYKQFYYKAYFQNKDALLCAIKLGDLENIPELLDKVIDAYKPLLTKDNKLLDDTINTLLAFYEEILYLAYHKEFLEIAEFLVLNYKKNILPVFQSLSNTEIKDVYKIDYLLRTNPKKLIQEYKDHLEEVNLMLDSSNNIVSYFAELIDTIHEKIIHNNEKHFFLNKHLYTTNSKVANILDEYYNHLVLDQNKVITDVMTFMKLNYLYSIPIHLVIPSVGYNPFYRPLILLDPHKDHTIYLPIQFLNSMTHLIHEITHFFFYILFENDANPFNNYIANIEYEKAINQTIKNVWEYALDNASSKYKNQKNIIIINDWYTKYRNQELLEEHTNELFNIITKSKTYNHYTLKDKEEWLVKFYKEKFNYTENFSYILNRIIDCCYNQSQDHKNIEFLTRLPELYVLETEKELLDLFNPTLKYWENI